MQPAKVNVLFAFFAYAGNGGVRSVIPEIAFWWANRKLEMKEDDRIGTIGSKIYGDIPLTMERNKVVSDAKAAGFDIIVMIDSDNAPDLYDGSKTWAKPFWETTFDFIYERMMRGIPSVVCSPYCGPPPHPVRGGEENVYVFYAEGSESDVSSPGHSFEAYSRTHAVQMRGIQSIAAGPTGCIAYTTDAFDLMPIRKETQAEVLEMYRLGELTQEESLRRINMSSWFFYEYTDQYQTQKASTEDVTNTREIQMAGIRKHGEPVVFCNWDAWAGHLKPKCVGMPEIITLEQVSDQFAEAVVNEVHAGDELREIDFTKDDAILIDPDVPERNVTDGDSSIAPKWRMIGDRKVASIGHVTPDIELSELTSIVEFISQSAGDRPLKIIEVGSWVGESALAMHAGLGDAGGVINCVDDFQGSPSDWTCEIASREDIHEWFKKNVGDLLGDEIRLFNGKSTNVARSIIDNGDADLIFIDADHSYESCTEDIAAWWRHVGDHGILCGHDYCDAFPGVIKAVDEFCIAAGVSPQILEGTSIWFVSKTQYLSALDALEKETEENEHAVV